MHPDFPRPPTCTNSGAIAETASPEDGDPAQEWEAAVVAAARILRRQNASPVTDHNDLPQEAGRDGEYRKNTWRTPGRHSRTRRARQAVYRSEDDEDVGGTHTSGYMEHRRSTWRTPGRHPRTRWARQAIHRSDSDRDVAGAHTSECVEARNRTPTSSGQRVRVETPLAESRDRVGYAIHNDGPRQFVERLDGSGRVSLRWLYPTDSSPPPRPPDRTS